MFDYSSLSFWELQKAQCIIGTEVLSRIWWIFVLAFFAVILYSPLKKIILNAKKNK